MSALDNPDTRLENRKARRQREKVAKAARRSANATPVASGSSSPKGSLPSGGSTTIAPINESLVAGNTTFEEGDDFIPFTFSDPDEDGDASAKPSRNKGKGKARDDVVDYKTEDRKDEERSKRREREQTPEREWDRGKINNDRDEGSARKRKHEMLFDADEMQSSKKQRLDAASRKAPWVRSIDWDSCKNVAEMLHREVEAFVNWISPSPVEDEIRGLIVSQVSNAVKKAFPDAQVLPFGSYQTKLYLPLGDIDLVILSDSMAYSDKVTVLHALANTLKRAGITHNVTIIAKAKVPIVKFVTMHGRFNVDISINQANGIVSGNIINGFLKDMHGTGNGTALRSLVLITKAFLSQRSMNEVFTGGLGSYSIMHPKIRRGEIDAEKNLGVLVMEFFELYGCYFNYDEVGISLREGGTYFNKRQRGWYNYQKKGMLSIEDPADPSNDISKGSYGFPKVRATLAGAHGILTSTAYLRAGMISSRRHGRSVNLRGHQQPEDMSILASVMGITQETINHRKLVQEVYDKRTLHRILNVQPLLIVMNSTTNKPSPQTSPQTNDKASSSSTNTHKSRGVESAWQAADDSIDYDDDPQEQQHTRFAQDDGDDEESGRYNIGRQPPKKRRRTGRQDDYHTVTFLPDEDDEDEKEETEAYAYGDIDYTRGDDHKGSSGSRRDPEGDSRRRSYWLSKATGPGLGGVELDYGDSE
ncbi:hypothetical protein BDQ12DRAFT_699647 [Crucibulum laeve]|uniref:polynucleotide adenylyltransferase n=1 Tax=Crucibulum laeve TaxID=68775 RepID=A0A5C3M5J0_9AGAR|nr:hypothetical protein BDQ12DRAFT_699647 [Crucibulum laeve]